MAEMQRVVVRQTGGPEQLEFETCQLPEPQPGQVLVRHMAIGVNFIDTYHRSGLYALPSLPHGLGLEAAGVVQRLGEGVAGLREGQRVGCVSGTPGAYATHRLVEAERLVPIPDAVSDEQAATVMLKGMTVEYLIHRTYPVESGQWVLWHAAAGGVGLIACQWLRHLGVRVIGTVGSEAKAQLARDAGAEVTIDYTRENFVERVKQLTEGEGVGVVFDSVGKATLRGSLDCLRRRGMFVSFGNASGKPDPIELGDLAKRGSLFATRPTLFDYTRTRDELLRSAARVFEAVSAGVIRPHTGQRFRLSEAERAHRELEARATTGSTVLVP